jgi:hypothetical protein
MEQLADKLTKGSNSFDKQQNSGMNHSLSMFDSEVGDVVSGTVRHQLSQHNTNMG